MHRCNSELVLLVCIFSTAISLDRYSVLLYDIFTLYMRLQSVYAYLIYEIEYSILCIVPLSYSIMILLCSTQSPQIAQSPHMIVGISHSHIRCGRGCGDIRCCRFD